MKPKRTIFDQPVVRVQTDKARFPKICPICGAQGTKQSRIIATPGKHQYLRPSWDPSFSPQLRRTVGIPQPISKSFVVNVCDEHYKSDEGDTNYKLMCMVGNGLLAAATFFAFIIIGGNLWIHRPVEPIHVGVVLAFFLSLLATVYAFRLGPLKNAVKIIGFDSGFDYVWFDFKLPEYRELFLKENQMHAEMVDWIVRS